MLIDADLGTLRGLLGTSNENLVTKGVASVPSSVRNLRTWSDHINHDSFCKTVTTEFTKLYGGDGIIQEVDETTSPVAQEVSNELKSWDWMYGQSPEFTNLISVAVPSGGEITFLIKARHALIESVEVASNNVEADSEWTTAANRLGEYLVGDRYESLEKTLEVVEKLVGTEKTRLASLVADLKERM